MKKTTIVEILKNMTPNYYGVRHIHDQEFEDFNCSKSYLYKTAKSAGYKITISLN